jgi:hypothetical protein
MHRSRVTSLATYHLHISHAVFVEHSWYVIVKGKNKMPKDDFDCFGSHSHICLVTQHLIDEIRIVHATYIPCTCCVF